MLSTSCVGIFLMNSGVHYGLISHRLVDILHLSYINVYGQVHLSKPVLDFGDILNVIYDISSIVNVRNYMFCCNTNFRVKK